MEPSSTAITSPVFEPGARVIFLHPETCQFVSGMVLGYKTVAILLCQIGVLYEIMPDNAKVETFTVTCFGQRHHFPGNGPTVVVFEDDVWSPEGYATRCLAL